MDKEFLIYPVQTKSNKHIQSDDGNNDQSLIIKL